MTLLVRALSLKLILVAILRRQNEKPKKCKIVFSGQVIQSEGREYLRRIFGVSVVTDMSHILAAIVLALGPPGLQLVSG